MNSTFLTSMRDDRAQSLDEMMDLCIEHSTKNEVKKSPRVNNDITNDLIVYNNASKVGRVLNHVFKSIFCNSLQKHIRITAKTYSDVVLIHMRDADGLDEDRLRPALLDMQPWVEELGGFLDITSHRPSETTVAFSFPNVPEYISNLN